jgi:hypothetical protein
MTQGKFERWHQTVKNRILFDQCYLLSDPEAQIDDFVAHDNHRRCHEASAISHPPTSTSGAAEPSCRNEKGSNNRQSHSAACNTKSKPLRSRQRMLRILN